MLYAISDVHLSLATDKPMDKFGNNWVGYVDKLRDSLSVLTEQDVLVVGGDISWAMRLSGHNGAIDDLRFLDSFKGRKILLKGNHDYWWDTAAKITRTCGEYGLHSLLILHNNAYSFGGVTIHGTRGWFYEEETGAEHDKKVMLREIGRLAASLTAPPIPLDNTPLNANAERVVFLHYPPIYRDYRCPEILQLLAEHNVKRCYYGHIHGAGHRSAFEGVCDGTEYIMLSADWLDFVPKRIAV